VTQKAEFSGKRAVQPKKRGFCPGPLYFYEIIVIIDKTFLKNLLLNIY